MTIHEIRNGDALTVIPEGRLDNISSPELEAFLDKNYPALTELTFDFEKLEYVSSAGLRVLVKAYKKMADRGGIRICHCNSLVLEVFKLTGFSDIFTVE